VGNEWRSRVRKGMLMVEKGAVNPREGHVCGSEGCGFVRERRGCIGGRGGRACLWIKNGAVVRESVTG